MTREQLLKEVESLDPQERHRLIEDIRQMPQAAELSAAQHAELLRRIEQLDLGKTVLLDGPQRLRDLLARYSQ